MKFLIAIAPALSLLCSITSYAASFQGLGDLPGGPFESVARRLSVDGSTVVGIGSGPKSSDDDFEAFRWRADTGMVSLGFLDSSDIGSTAHDVSRDGDIVIGDSDGVAFRWTAATGTVNAGLPPGALAYAISDNGQTLVGSMNTFAGTRAMRWTEANGAQILPTLPGNLSTHVATGVSADGSVVAGYRSDNARGFYWSEQTGTVELSIPSGAAQAQAMSISPDGSTIVGRLFFLDHNEAVAWKTTGELLRLPGFGGANAQADGASADGSIIVGYAETLGPGSTAFIWDAVHGTRSLHEVLVGLGVDLSGWRLAQATDISADGLTIVGYGQNPNGFTEAWIATVPEPSMLMLATIGGCVATAAHCLAKFSNRRAPAA